ncbi:hypothetical protein [Bosea vestrisii]|uniref:hypothetical protein n=1 Tax=Bosea vestrisii TaxID=151416 RepID=UPI0032675D10
MEHRLTGLGHSWQDATVANIYTVRDIHPLLADVLLPITSLGRGLTWHFSRPPVAVLDYEMDVRGLSREIVIEAQF